MAPRNGEAERFKIDKPFEDAMAHLLGVEGVDVDSDGDGDDDGDTADEG